MLEWLNVLYEKLHKDLNTEEFWTKAVDFFFQ